MADDLANEPPFYKAIVIIEEIVAVGPQIGITDASENGDEEDRQGNEAPQCCFFDDGCRL